MIKSWACGQQRGIPVRGSPGRRGADFGATAGLGAIITHYDS